MEALLTTVALGVLIVAILIVLARSWPRSSQLGGYHVAGGAGQADEPQVREDDEAHWHWEDREPDDK